MASAYQFLQRLTRHPHRGSATAAEGAAMTDAAGWLRAMGWKVSVEPFLAPRDTLYLGPAIVLLGAVTAAGLAALWPWAGLLLWLALLAILIGEMSGSLAVDFDWLLTRHPSRNLVARLGPETAADQVVITAHMDTQRASWLFHPRVVGWLPAYFYVVYAGVILLGVGLAGQALGAAWAGALIRPGAIACLANALVLLICRLTGRYTNGANDNGSGVALVLALADRLREHPPTASRVTVLLTGSEEVGLRGMKHFLRKHRPAVASTRFIVLDNLGRGALHYLTGEGMIRYHRYCPTLIEAAAATGEEGATPRPRRNLLLPTDGLIPATLGYRAITFIAFDQDGSLPEYHWYTDRLDRIDPQALATAERFLIRYVARLTHSTPELNQ